MSKHVTELELLVTEERPDFNTLHGLALQRLRWDRAMGVPLEGRAYMLYQWLLDLIVYDVADPNIVHEVQLTLEDDEEVARSEHPESAKKLADALDAAGV